MYDREYSQKRRDTLTAVPRVPELPYSVHCLPEDSLDTDIIRDLLAILRHKRFPWRVMNRQVSGKRYLCSQDDVFTGVPQGLVCEAFGAAGGLLKPVLDMLRRWHPRHSISFVFLKSDPHCGPQLWHRDWVRQAMSMDDQPFSCLLPLHDSAILESVDGSGVHEHIVHVGELFRLRYDLIHRGGANPLPIPQFRIHFYACHADNIHNTPDNEVYLVDDEPCVQEAVAVAESYARNYELDLMSRGTM